MTLLHHFYHHTCSIYWLLNLCLVIVSYNWSQMFFLNALLSHSRIVINFFHSWIITICQAKNSQTRENNIDKYISPLQWLITINFSNCFGGFLFVGIILNSADNMVYWTTFLICKSLCIPMKYPAILVSFPLNIPIYLLWNSWYLYLNIEWGWPS